MSAVIEWLEAMYRAAGPDADKAREALELIAVAEASEDYLDELGEKLGDFDEAEGLLDRQRNAERWAERDLTFKDFGDLDEETLERFARAYDRYEQQSFDLQKLAADAGLIATTDFTTNPIPLLAMFVPPAE